MFPAWWGQPGSLNLGGPDNFIERTVYAGSIVLLLACVSICHRAAWRRKAPLVALAVVGLAVPFGLPIVHSLVTSLPLLDSVTDSRMILLFMFAVSVLAAFGLEALIDADEVTLPRAQHVVGVAVLRRCRRDGFRPADAARSSGRARGNCRPWRHRCRRDECVLVADARRRHRAPPAGTPAVWTPTQRDQDGNSADAAGGRRHAPFRPRLPDDRAPRRGRAAHHARADLPAAERPKRHPAIVALDDSLPGNSGTVFGLADVRGYDPPQPSLRYLHLWQRANPHQGPTVLALPAMTDVGSRVLSALGAHFVVTAPNDNLEPWRTLKLSTAGPTTVYRTTEPPRAPSYRLGSKSTTVSKAASRRSRAQRSTRVATPSSRRADQAPARLTSRRGRSRSKWTRTIRRGSRRSGSRGGLVVLNDAWARRAGQLRSTGTGARYCAWTMSCAAYKCRLDRTSSASDTACRVWGSASFSSVGALLVLLAIIGVSGWRHTGRNRMPR